MEFSRLLSAAMAAANAHLGEMERRDKLHLRETERRDVLHHDEMSRRQVAYDHEVDMIRAALESRDIIGQAKGIIIATMGCTSDEAFNVLKDQSQAENRKLHDVAADIVSTTQRRTGGSS